MKGAVMRAELSRAVHRVSESPAASWSMVVSQCRAVGAACTSPTRPVRVWIVAAIGIDLIIAVQRRRRRTRGAGGGGANPAKP